MELSAESGSDIDIGEYKTPIQKLARRFKESVQLWKSKYLEVKATIKYYQNLAADARRSRDHWKEKYEQMKSTSDHLQAELARLRVEATVGSPNAAVEKKRPMAALS